MLRSKLLFVLLAGLLVVGALTGCQSDDGTDETEAPDTLTGSLSLAGSTTVQPVAEAIAQAFSATYPDVQVDVQGGGSSTGVKSAGQDTVDTVSYTHLRAHET